MVDSKPTFQAYQKLNRGELSTSKRLNDLLGNLSALRLSVQHISAKLPSPLLSMVDFASRNPVECNDPSCRVCLDLSQSDTTFVGATQIKPNLYLASTAAWRDIQQSCPDLRRVHALLQSGKTPSKKEKNQKDVRAYLRLCTINKADLLVCRKPVPFQSKPAELIVIPRSHAFTFAKALHVKLDHPLPHQFRLRFARQYCILDKKNVLQSVYDTCDVPCQASRILPKETLKFTTKTKPEIPGNFLNADVMIESKQKILVVRDNLTSFTQATLISGEKKETLKEALFTLGSNLRLGPTAVIRVDSHSSLASLHTDGSLQQLGFTLDLGHPKNVNKNSPAERAIRELRE